MRQNIKKYQQLSIKNGEAAPVASNPDKDDIINNNLLSLKNLYDYLKNEAFPKKTHNYYFLHF
jgi:hypothetical protein